ncbi:SDR family oxidoreductase [Streptomyces sp. NPDC004589]|uniref:SDR family oxidoreductase n=1 Tax=Streptomyces sp. NPDC004589 TaxID=3154553 RepID=UPI0033AE1D4B
MEALLRLVQCIRRAWTGERGGTVVDNCTQSAGPAGPNVGDYGTGKAALLHPTRHLAGELAPKVRVTPPGSSARRRPDRSGRTARTPSPQGCRSRRFGRLEDVARAVLRPVSDAADRITGTDLPGDGGTRAGPAYVPESSASGTYAIRHRLHSCAPHRL